MKPVIDVHIRLPAGLHEQLREQAERDQRSLNNLMVLLLRRGLEPPPASKQS